MSKLQRILENNIKLRQYYKRGGTEHSFSKVTVTEVSWGRLVKKKKKRVERALSVT